MQAGCHDRHEKRGTRREVREYSTPQFCSLPRGELFFQPSAIYSGDWVIFSA
jgi:hypothetical protein